MRPLCGTDRWVGRPRPLQTRGATPIQPAVDTPTSRLRRDRQRCPAWRLAAKRIAGAAVDADGWRRSVKEAAMSVVSIYLGILAVIWGLLFLYKSWKGIEPPRRE